MAETKSKPFPIRLKPSEYAKFKMLAEQENCNMSEFGRLIILEKIKQASELKQNDKNDKY